MPGHRRFRDVSVAIEENKIVQIGEFRELKRKYGGEVYDAKGALILPGFPNAHMHSAMSLMRGIPDGLTLDEWVKGYIWPFEKSLTSEYSYLGAAVATLESVRNGITLVNEMHLNIESVARAFEDIGIRSVLSVPLMDMPGSLYEDSKSAMNANRALFRMVERSSGRLNAYFGPCTIRLTSKKLLEMIFLEYRKMKKEGKRTGIHMHLCEVKEDVEFSKKNYGMRPAEFLYKIGIMNEDAVFAHCVHLDENDINLLARSGASVAHCLSSNLKLRSGLANLPLMLSKGVN
ncbi:MAG: amidohydrolase family protein, partial [Thermoplasmata archaeon]